MEKRHPQTERPVERFAGFGQGLPVEPFPLGVYPVFDDDLPRDSEFENFAAPDLRDQRPYPWGLK